MTKCKLYDSIPDPINQGTSEEARSLKETVNNGQTGGLNMTCGHFSSQNMFHFSPFIQFEETHIEFICFRTK